MKRLDLYSRIRGSHERKEGGECGLRDIENLRSALGGRVVSNGKGRVLITEKLLPQGFLHGKVNLTFPGEVSLSPLSVLFPAVEGQYDISPRNLLFFDIETTGLSGGAGTYIFLAGFLMLEDEGFRLRQYFLDKLSAERLFLELIEKEFLSRRVLVSYNGKSFDYGIIKNRFIMNGLPLHELEPLHLDLLYPSRRIWKGILEDFSLPTVERLVLRLSRESDIPAWSIPEVYADYLRGRDVAREILSVFHHNKNDVLSLLALLLKQLSLLSGAEGGEGGAAQDTRELYNPFSLSDMYLLRGKTQRARKILLAHSGSAEALRRLGLIYKREQSYEDALSCFRLLAEKCGEVQDYLFACTEAAKIFEHVLRDYKSAMVYTKKMMDRMDRGFHFYPHHIASYRRESTDIERRLQRLMRKLSG